MRKLILVLAGSVGFTAFSQDVIVTKSSEQIRAKIIEVTDDAVSYKKYHDQEGATFVLKKDKIKIISWENGNVDEYEQNPPTEEISPVKEGNNLPFIKKRGSTFYLDNGEVYSAEQLKDFLIGNNLTPTWLRYEKGSNLLLTGWALIGVGATMYAVGLMSMSNQNFDNILPSVLLGCGGGLAVYVGMPIAIVGSVKRNRTINEYNSIYGGRPSPQYSQDVTFKAGLTGNGLGFTLNF